MSAQGHRGAGAFEARIRGWRERAARHGCAALSSAALDELEDHLRALLGEEMSAASPVPGNADGQETEATELDLDAAWRRAVARLGRPAGVAAEFDKLADEERRARLRSPRSGLRRAPRAMLTEMAQDVRFASRLMARTPAATLLAILTLAVGIGAVTWVFSLARATLLAPPRSVLEPHRLVLMYDDFDGRAMLTSHPRYLEYRDRNEVLSNLSAFAHMPVHLRARDTTERHRGSLVTGSYFTTLGLSPWRGRFLGSEDDARPGAHPVAVISHELWRSRFAGQDAAIGEPIAVNGVPYTVIGVAPPRFAGVGVAAGVDVWVPMMMQPTARPGRDGQLTDSRIGWLQLIGRLRDDVDLATAQQHMSEIVRGSAYEKIGSDGALLYDRYWVSPYLRENLTEFNLLLAAVVAVVLLLAWANVAALMLARAAGRRREVVTRAALGAGRGRLVRQLLAEGATLAVAGGIVGLLLALAGNRLLATLQLTARLDFARVDLRLDPAAVVFTLGVAFASSLVFALGPALRISRPGTLGTLRGAASAASGASRTRALLVTVQIGAACTLLVAAGLLVRTLGNLGAVDPGFEADGVATFTVDLELEGRDPIAGATLVGEIDAAIRAVPGATSASFGDAVPFSTVSVIGRVDWIYMDGVPAPAGLLPEGLEAGAEGPMLAPLTYVGPDYFATLGIDIVAGRRFGPDEAEAGRRSVIVSRSSAANLWPDRGAIGQTIRVGRGDAAEILEVVGVVEDVRSGDLTRDQTLWLYRPYAQRYRPVVTFLARAAPGVPDLLPRVLVAARAVEPTLTFYAAERLADRVRRSLSEQLLLSRLIGLFAAVSLLLAAAGTYGMVAQTVGNAARDIGIRRALGARTYGVLATVGRIGGLPALGGLATGLGGGWLAGRALRGSIHGVTPHDPATLIAVVALMVAVVTMALVGPARQALRVDPSAMLREE